jgi:hypothetical protein
MQGVLVFASTAARDAAITSPQEGQFAFTKDTDQLWYRSASAWVASGATGDIEGVTAGTGISGGGTSGTVTITNSMATAIDAKGDLIAGTGADTFSRIGVGANNTVLTADSAEATGLKWATPAGASFVGVSLFNTTNQSIPDSTATAMTYNSETYDTDGFHDTVTNTDRITIPAGKAGKYLLTGVMYFSANTTGIRLLDFQVNGTSNPGTCVDTTNGGAGAQTICQVRTLAVADYVSIRAYQTSGGNLNNNNTFNGSFTATYLGA